MTLKRRKLLTFKEIHTHGPRIHDIPDRHIIWLYWYFLYIAIAGCCWYGNSTVIVHIVNRINIGQQHSTTICNRFVHNLAVHINYCSKNTCNTLTMQYYHIASIIDDFVWLWNRQNYTRCFARALKRALNKIYCTDKLNVNKYGYKVQKCTKYVNKKNK